MHPGILVGPAMSFLIGGFISWMIYLFTKKKAPKRRQKVSWIVWTLCLCAWLFYASGLFYWYQIVELGLDGTEGSGVGFGFFLIHIGGAIQALFFTGIAMVFGTLAHGK